MSIGSFLDVDLAIDIIPKKGGQCSFCCNFPKNKDLVTEISVRLDTTLEENEVLLMKAKRTSSWFCVKWFFAIFKSSIIF